jgi:HEAT repeat protein
MADQSSPGDIGNPEAVANYVATISADLAGIARRTGLETLRYLLEMVRLEAESVARNPQAQNGGR